MSVVAIVVVVVAVFVVVVFVVVVAVVVGGGYVGVCINWSWFRWSRSSGHGRSDGSFAFRVPKFCPGSQGS